MNILKIIKAIEEEKKQNRIAPSHALLTEVISKASKLGFTRENVLDEIEDKLYWGEIITGHTINDKFIKVL